jgi:hypothetical protein
MGTEQKHKRPKYRTTFVFGKNVLGLAGATDAGVFVNPHPDTARVAVAFAVTRGSASSYPRW